MQSIAIPQKPKFTSLDEKTGKFEIEGCYPGYGTTLGNALRRVLLSSLEGAAVISAKIKGVTGEVFLQMLETRLDSVVFLSGFATSRQSARQMIRHKKVKVDGKIIDIPSYQISKDNLISVDTIQSRTKVVEDLPVWISWDEKKNGISVINLPNRDDISSDINEQLIVEFYSR